MIMLNTVFITIMFSFILAVLLGTGFIKTVKFNFNKEEPRNTYEDKTVKETLSERAERVKEKNQQLMDRVRAQMEKNKR